MTASKGHIVALDPKRLGVDPASGYALEWTLLPKKKQDLQLVEEATRGAKAIVLATDPDREGEGISWHLLNHLQVSLQVRVSRGLKTWGLFSDRLLLCLGLHVQTHCSHVPIAGDEHHGSCGTERSCCTATLGINFVLCAYPTCFAMLPLIKQQ